MDSDIRNKLIRAWLGSAVRAVILMLGAWLKASGKLPGFVDDTVIGEWTAKAPDIAGDIMVVVPLLWTSFQKWRSHDTLQAVKDAQAGTPIAAAVALKAKADGIR